MTAREFRDRFTVLPDSGETELQCSRCPSPDGTWRAGYHPSLDALNEQARVHNLTVHGEQAAPS